uniref:Swt1 family HEPN domain-containing protein n=1 Tax=Arthrobacter sp. TaxID=1667 RepID=UPI00159EEC74|nr:Swt1 family HEPN domain-containing protein [Arthrobacter sp.]
MCRCESARPARLADSFQEEIRLCDYFAMDLDEDSLSNSTINQLSMLSRNGLSETALLLYGRWWQFEDWLRQLAYVELRTKYGRDWVAQCNLSTYHQDNDAEWTHMLTRDNENLLAYFDFLKLSQLMCSNWVLFKHALPRRETWDSLVSELNMVRRRIAHLRMAHTDDLARLEQALRDLERGAFITLASYNDRWPARVAETPDPITDGWVKQEHVDAQRLLAHAETRYEVSFYLRTSHRPWSSSEGTLDGLSGRLWHAEFYSRQGSINVEEVWRNGHFKEARSLAVHVEVDSPNSFSLTFTDVDDRQEIADAIGGAFDAILMSLTPHSRQTEISDKDRTRKLRELNYKILAGTGWNIVDSSTVPITIFASGGGVNEAPSR